MNDKARGPVRGPLFVLLFLVFAAAIVAAEVAPKDTAQGSVLSLPETLLAADPQSCFVKATSGLQKCNTRCEKKSNVEEKVKCLNTCSATWQYKSCSCYHNPKSCLKN